MGEQISNKMQRNSTNSGRGHVERLVECKHTPTLVYYADGSIAIQHPIVYELMRPITQPNEEIMINGIRNGIRDRSVKTLMLINGNESQLRVTNRQRRLRREGIEGIDGMGHMNGKNGIDRIE